MFSVWLVLLMFFFFFKQKTAYEMRISDWSSDVCSSDLGALHGLGGITVERVGKAEFVDGGARFGTARVGGNMAGEAAGANRPGERGADATGSEQCHPLAHRRVVSPAISRRVIFTPPASAPAGARMGAGERPVGVDGVRCCITRGLQIPY